MDCIINGHEYELQKVEKLGWGNFCVSSIQGFPKKLYKYFPNTTVDKLNTDTNLVEKINYSQLSLTSNTIYMQNPIEFDDPFDANLFIDNAKFIHLRLKYYLKEANIAFDEKDTIENLTYLLSTKLYSFFNPNLSWVAFSDKLKHFFNISSDDKSCELQKQLFISNIITKLQDNAEWYDAIWFAIHDEFNYGVNSKKLRISSFTTSPYLVRMWSTYADYHRGFCVEYDCSNYDINNAETRSYYHNTFPVIYTNEISDLSEQQNINLSRDGFLEDDMFSMYFYGALRKSTVWKDQLEWRYVLPNLNNQDPNKGFSTPYFKINKIYLGKKMDMYKRQELITLCEKSNIPYIGVTISANCYEMIDCPQNCKDCLSK